jgi:hypothetical protein
MKIDSRMTMLNDRQKFTTVYHGGGVLNITFNTRLEQTTSYTHFLKSLVLAGKYLKKICSY